MSRFWHGTGDQLSGWLAAIRIFARSERPIVMAIFTKS